MLVDFIQGIVSYQNSSTKYISIMKNTISINCEKVPLIVNFAHGKYNYLHRQTKSINPAFTVATNKNYYFFIEIDIFDGSIKFNYTTKIPTYGDEYPVSPELNEHFFNVQDRKMYYYNASGWVECLRVFIGSFVNGKLILQALGTQVNLNTPCASYEIIYDYKNRPIKRFNDDNTYHFITTDTLLNNQNINLSNIKFTNLIQNTTTDESLFDYCLVGFADYNKLGLASYDGLECIGMVEIHKPTQKINKIITEGFVTNNYWQLTEDFNTNLFVSLNGAFSTDIPSTGYIQNIGHIVNSKTIYLNLSNPIYINGSDDPPPTI